jgi:hypothetical protein
MPAIADARVSWRTFSLRPGGSACLRTERSGLPGVALDRVGDVAVDWAHRPVAYGVKRGEELVAHGVGGHPKLNASTRGQGDATIAAVSNALSSGDTSAAVAGS